MMSTSPAGVRQISECFIKPKQLEEDRSRPVYLNTWDLAVLSVRYMHWAFFILIHQLIRTWKQTTTTTLAVVDQLKEALSIALVHFHTLAGQLETRLSENGKSSVIFIDPSKGPGAKFVHAAAIEDLGVSDLLSSLTNNTTQFAHLFFPHLDAVNHDGHHLPLLIVQVTQLLDGILIGCSMNHVCCDASSYWHFVNSWSDIFMKKKNGGDPVTYTERWFLDGVGPIIELPFSHPDEFIPRPDTTTVLLSPSTPPNPLRGRIFHFSSDSIRKIKSRANDDSKSSSETTTTTTTTINNNEISSFQALSALVWRCVTRARSVPPDEVTACRFSGNNRRILNPPLPDNYFGNCVQTFKVSAKAGELLAQSLGWAAMMLNRAVAAHSDKKVRDTVASRMRQNPVIRFPPAPKRRNYDLRLVGSPRLDMYRNDFGLGKPVAVFSGFSYRDGIVAYGPGRQGGWSMDLEICLSADTMCALESDQELHVSRVLIDFFINQLVVG